MDATSAAAAQCHYQSGRYHDALIALEQSSPVQQNASPPQHLDSKKITSCEQNKFDWITAEFPPVQSPPLKLRAELSALPLAAHRADVSMCRFRSAIHSSTVTNISSRDAESENDSSLLRLWEEAIRTNATYRQALMGAASSLISRGFTEMEFLHQIKTQIEPIRSTNANTTEGRKAEHSSIQNAMKSTAVSILMASIAAAHLYLHEINTQESNAKAWNVLVHSASLAADLLCARRDVIHCISTEMPTAESCVEGTLESSLKILNETLDDERSVVALHSFRVALKVAALACGKLVLPKIDLQAEEGKAEPPRKRLRKDQVLHNQRNSNDENDVWNATYSHCNAILYSRERLVDAISFHWDLIHSTSKMKHSTFISGTAEIQKGVNELFLKRETCFKEAIQWESKLKALLVADQLSSKSPDDATGYVWKIYICLRSLEIADSKHESNAPNRNDDKKKILSSLNQLAMSSTSRFACEIMGSIHVKNGEYSRAIEMFQMSLERGGKGSGYHDVDSDVEISHELVERRVVLNMSTCFVAMGDTNTPLELLLHLWSELNESHDELDFDPQPKALLLSSDLKEIEGARVNGPNATRILWMLFHVSSLAGDWVTCLGTTEELRELLKDEKDAVSRVYIDCAGAFALLQCRKEIQSQEIAKELVQTIEKLDSKHHVNTVASILAEIYAADGSLILEQESESSNTSPFQCTSRAVSSLSTYISQLENKESRSLLELRVLVLNNHGLGCLTRDDSAGALQYFREALGLIKNNANQFWLSIPIHFNLALLLLRDGRVDESAKTWLSVRGHLKTWDSAKQGDSNSLSRLRDSHLLAMNRHGMVLAKRNRAGASTSTFDCKTVTEWVPPVLEEEKWQEDLLCINGVDVEQVSTLDFVLLKYALSVAEKKSSSMFRRHSGLIGY